MKRSSMASRPLMFAASSVWVALILVVSVFRWGGTTPVERPLAPAGPPTLVQQADQLAARGEYDAAAAKYEAALEQDRDSIALRFALGTALSYVGRQEETAEQFDWVLKRGAPGSPEVRMARRWLVTAGRVADPVTFAAVRASAGRVVPPGRVTGRTEWTNADPKGDPSQVSLVLRGAEDSNQAAVFGASVKLGERYEFATVPPGTYRLTARLAERTLWEQLVTVEPGGETVQELRSDNRTVSAHEERGAH